MMTMEQLIEEAKKARELAYVPYSKFQVGSAILTEDNEVIHGCNVENASYGLCNCAERTALFKAYSNGITKSKFKAMVIIADTDGPCSPCGACRQVISELTPKGMPIYLANLKGDVQKTDIEELLPGAFTPEDLNE